MAECPFGNAPEVEAIAQELIELHHQRLVDFNVRIRYIFNYKQPKSGGKVVWGKVRKISGLPAFLEGKTQDHDAFFVIEITRDVWDAMPEEKRRPLIDHYLCGVGAEVKQQKDEAESDEDLETDNPVKLSVRTPDVQEYTEIVKRWGYWQDGIDEVVAAALTPKKDDEEADEAV